MDFDEFMVSELSSMSDRELEAFYDAVECGMYVEDELSRKEKSE